MCALWVVVVVLTRLYFSVLGFFFSLAHLFLILVILLEEVLLGFLFCLVAFLKIEFPLNCYLKFCLPLYNRALKTIVNGLKIEGSFPIV